MHITYKIVIPIIATGIALGGGYGAYEKSHAEESADTTIKETAAPSKKSNAAPKAISVTKMVKVPSYNVNASVWGQSIEKDLTLVLSDANGNRIYNVPFEIKLVSPDERTSLDASIASIQDINNQISQADQDGTSSTAYKEENNKQKNASSNIKLLAVYPDGTEETMTKKDQLLREKQQALADYKNQLDALEGNTYTDDDQDGLIQIDSIDPGDYAACLVPVDNVDSSTYITDVNVKDQIAYEPVENIQQQTVSTEEAGDVQPVVEQKTSDIPQDTVQYVESSEQEVTVQPESTPSNEPTAHPDNTPSSEPSTEPESTEIPVPTNTPVIETVYQGWQTFNGNKYYYVNGTPITGEQIIQGVRYNFGADGALNTSGRGIDVSQWQGDINWQQASGFISFANIRVGYRGSSSRKLAEDPYAITNLITAKGNGLAVGAYFYSTAQNEKEAVEEASLALDVVNKAGGVSMPIYIDMEDATQSGLSNEERTAIINAFANTIRAGGYTPGVYTNLNWFNNKINTSQLNCTAWVAQWSSQCTYSGSYSCWQYSDAGSIPGINGYVDLDIAY